MSEQNQSDIVKLLERIAIAVEKIADKPGYVKRPIGPKLTCPKCGKTEAIRESKIAESPGYYCWIKLNGCGAKGLTKEQLLSMSVPDVPVIPLTVKHEDGRDTGVTIQQAKDEDLYAKASKHSKYAWIYDDSPMTEDDLLLFNMVNRANQWAPSRLLKCSREEFSIKTYQAMTEDTSNYVLNPDVARHLLELLKSIQPDQTTLDKLIDIVVIDDRHPTFAQALSESALMRWLDDIS